MKNKILEIINNITWFQVGFNLFVLIVVIVKSTNLTYDRIINFIILMILGNIFAYRLGENYKKLKDFFNGNY